MGTRNITMVIQNAETKVAQYGQWDGYPEGQGFTCLDFLRNADLSIFREKVSKLSWLTEEQIETINADKNWTETYPYLSRDCAAKILEVIQYGKIKTGSRFTGGERTSEVSVIGLVNEENFLADSLMCEWAYVIDLDKNVFEVYKGFNKTPLTESDRFFSLPLPERSGEYHQVKIAKSYPLTELPTNEQFIADLQPVESEE